MDGVRRASPQPGQPHRLLFTRSNTTASNLHAINAVPQLCGEGLSDVRGGSDQLRWKLSAAEARSSGGAEGCSIASCIAYTFGSLLISASPSSPPLGSIWGSWERDSESSATVRTLKPFPPGTPPQGQKRNLP